MKIVFTKHARKKFSDLARIGVKVSQKALIDVVKSPEHVDRESDYPKLIASRSTDLKHIIRVVFKIKNDIITIITFYPARKGRYYVKETN